jgi:hypothetical protein
MNRHLLYLTTLLLIALSACMTPPNTAVYQPQVNCYIPPGSAPEAVATLTTRCQQDAQATIAVQAQATRQVQAATAVAIQQSTAQALAIAESTAVAAAATSENLVVRQTEQAMAFQQSDATATAAAQQMWLQATGTAVAVQASALATAEAQRAENVAMVQRDTQQMLENQRAREAFWNRAYPWIVTVVLLVLVVGTGFWLFLQWRNRQPVMQVIFDNGNGRQTIPIIRDAHGGYRHLPGTLPHQGGRLALPAGDEVVETAVEPIPLPKLDIGHVLIVGETGAGKSTTMRALLAHRQQAVVLDPHAGPDDWPGMQVLGGGRNFTQISEFMDWMVDELSNRAEQRRNGQTAFPPLTVATDEMPAIANELGKDVYANWQRWMREGRKFGLYIVVSTQSTRVKTMGIEGEGDVLNNFAGIVYLGKTAVEEYPELASSMEWPAVLRTKRGPRPVIIPHNPDAPTYPSSRVVEPPQIHLSPRVSQAEQDGRKLDGRIQEISSLNAAGVLLSDDVTERPSGQFLQERLRPALEWRAQQLGCEHAQRLLMRYQS